MESCKEAVEMLVDYIHKELDETDDTRVKGHLDVCEKCCSRFEFEEKLTTVIQEKAGKDQCPEDLKKTIQEKIKKTR